MTINYTHVVAHYAEIIIKGKNRSFFESTLLQNARSILSDSAIHVHRRAGRLVVELSKPFNNVRSDFKRILGIVNFSPCLVVKSEIDEIKKAALTIAKYANATTFKISTQRAWKQFPLNSQQINEDVGAHVLKKTKKNVRMKNPGLTITIEVTPQETYVHAETYDAFGGLPSGTAGKIVSLLSGGIDSPVSSFLMMKRGATVVLVHCMNKTIISSGVQDKIEQLAKQLARYQLNMRLYIVPFDAVQREIVKHVSPRYRMIVYRRFMLRIGERVMKKEGAKALVTGDSLSQVASQTLDNLRAVRSVTDQIILSPLIGSNKQEIIDLAEKIGTYPISILPYNDCCSFLVAKHPELNAKSSQIDLFEKSLDIKELVYSAVRNAKRITY